MSSDSVVLSDTRAGVLPGSVPYGLCAAAPARGGVVHGTAVGGPPSRRRGLPMSSSAGPTAPVVPVRRVVRGGGPIRQMRGGRTVAARLLGILGVRRRQLITASLTGPCCGSLRHDAPRGAAYAARLASFPPHTSTPSRPPAPVAVGGCHTLPHAPQARTLGLRPPPGQWRARRRTANTRPHCHMRNRSGSIALHGLAGSDRRAVEKKKSGQNARLIPRGLVHTGRYA